MKEMFLYMGIFSVIVTGKMIHSFLTLPIIKEITVTYVGNVVVVLAMIIITVGLFYKYAESKD